MNKYNYLKAQNSMPSLWDHGTGFDQNLQNSVLYNLNNNASTVTDVLTEYNVNRAIRNNYQNLNFKFDIDFKLHVMEHFRKYTTHPTIEYKNFVCSFNGNDHVGRKLLTATLHKFGYFNTDYCTKHFEINNDELSGYVKDYMPMQQNFYNKFFLVKDGDFTRVINKTSRVDLDHSQNIHNLESILTQSFLHIVSESLSTSYYPFVTEKFLYSVVTRGLFLTNGQPGWHAHLEKYYGFLKYTQIFDYTFDTIENPLERMVTLMSMLSKFKILSPLDWHDLYLLELDTIEYNYDHYFSGHYREWLAQHQNDN